MSLTFHSSLWSKAGWWYRYLLLVWLADAVSKAAITNWLELGTGHFLERSGWGFGVLWVEHAMPPSYPGWRLALAALALWAVIVVLTDRKKITWPEGFLRGMQVSIAGIVANITDAGFDRSVTDWMGVITPWFNKAFNLADLVMTLGFIEMLSGLIGLTAWESVRRKLLSGNPLKKRR